MNSTLFKPIEQHPRTAYAYQKIICAKDGIPYDYEFIEINTEFEKITGIKGADLTGKRMSDFFQVNANDKFDWISFFGDVALHDVQKDFELYSKSFRKHFWGKAFSPQKGYFITLIDERSIDRQALDAAIIDQTGVDDDSFILNSIRSSLDHSQAEADLVASELRYRRLFESAKDGILILDADTGRIIDVNQFLIDLLGYSKEQFMDKSIWDIGFFSDVIASKENYLELLKNQYIRYEDLPLRTTSGRSIHVEFVSNVYIEDQRKVVQCNIRDITERFDAMEALSVSDKKFESYIEHAPGGVFISDENDHYIEANRAASMITGYSVPQLLTMTVGDITTEESLANARALFAALKENGKMSGELQFKHKSGLKRWWSVDAVKLSETRFLGFSNDITDRKKAEEHLLFLGHHDQLTGLHNRRYFENIIGSIDTEANLPISLIICDINGLKLANDSFGHFVGDTLLVHTARILEGALHSGDVVARIGGDEFILICPRTNRAAVIEKIDDIKRKMADIDVSGLKLSLSFGYETKETSHQTFIETLSNAENHMYRHKLFEESSFRSKTIDVIMQTLFEKSSRELMHSKRVSEYCQAIAFAMNFDNEVIDRIRIAGLVHDIGKIGVKESILNKKSGLSGNDWTEMKKHPEIGWRILSAANEFYDLAHYVLNHHEKWDGTGYPNGAKQESIPIEARIIALADAFDAMTSKRSYRDALSQDLAIDEIIRCSGTHFDPAIVDVFVNKVMPMHFK